MASVDQQISAAEAAARAAEDKAITYAERAQNVSQGYSTPGERPSVTAPTIVTPPYIPDVQLAAVFQSDFNATWTELDTALQDAMSGWMAAYFPTLNPELPTSGDTWLLSVINDGYSGIPAALEQAIWDRARGKENIEALRMEEEAAEQIAARGFSIPPGVLASRILQVQQTAADKSATIARDLAVKQIETAVDMVKLAVTEVTRLRLGVAQVLADFMRAWLTVPQSAADIAKAKAQMQQHLWQSGAEYIRAQVEIARLSLDAQRVNADVTTKYQELEINAWYHSLDNQVQAAIQSAVEMGRVAAAARGAQNTIVSDTTNRAIASTA